MTHFDFAAIEQRVTASGMQMDDFYGRIGVHRTTWQRWKRGEGEPRLSTVARIEEILPTQAAA